MSMQIVGYLLDAHISHVPANERTDISIQVTRWAREAYPDAHRIGLQRDMAGDRWWVMADVRKTLDGPALLWPRIERG